MPTLLIYVVFVLLGLIFPSKITFITGLFLLILTAGSIFLGHQGLAQKVLIYSFGVFAVGLVRYLYEIRSG